MKSPFLIPFLFAVGLFLNGCETVMTGPSHLPGETVIDARGEKEVLDDIRWLDRAANKKDCPQIVKDTKRAGKEWDTIIEHWWVDSCGVITEYKIRIAPLGGGMKYTVTFPSAAE